MIPPEYSWRDRGKKDQSVDGNARRVETPQATPGQGFHWVSQPIQRDSLGNIVMPERSEWRGKLKIGTIRPFLHIGSSQLCNDLQRTMSGYRRYQRCACPVFFVDHSCLTDHCSSYKGYLCSECSLSLVMPPYDRWNKYLWINLSSSA